LPKKIKAEFTQVDPLSQPGFTGLNPSCFLLRLDSGPGQSGFESTRQTRPSFKTMFDNMECKSSTLSTHGQQSPKQRRTRRIYTWLAKKPPTRHPISQLYIYIYNQRVSYTPISSSSSSSSFISIFYFTSLKAALKPRSIKKLQRDGDGEGDGVIGIGILSYKKENKNGSGISSSIWKNQSATRPTSK